MVNKREEVTKRFKNEYKKTSVISVQELKKPVKGVLNIRYKIEKILNLIQKNNDLGNKNQQAKKNSKQSSFLNSQNTKRIIETEQKIKVLPSSRNISDLRGNLISGEKISQLVQSSRKIHRALPNFKPRDDSSNLLEKNVNKMKLKVTNNSADVKSSKRFRTELNEGEFANCSLLQSFNCKNGQDDNHSDQVIEQIKQTKNIISSVIFVPDKLNCKRQIMTTNFLKEKLGTEKFESIKQIYFQKNRNLLEIEKILSKSQKNLSKLFPIIFEYSTPTTHASGLSFNN